MKPSVLSAVTSPLAADTARSVAVNSLAVRPLTDTPSAVDVESAVTLPGMERLFAPLTACAVTLSAENAVCPAACTPVAKAPELRNPPDPVDVTRMFTSLAEGVPAFRVTPVPLTVPSPTISRA